MNRSESSSPWVIEADEATFQQQVVERSRELPVVIDFWAEWCQPCRLLGPILEKLAADYAGKFLLVKAETDKTPNVASAFGVQSIPAVFAMRDGQLIDYFVGLKPENQLRAWIDRLLPSQAELLVAEARQAKGAQPAAAEAKYREAAQLDANLAAARIELAELLIAQGRHDEAQAIVDELERRGFMEPEAEKLKAELHLARQTAAPVDLSALRAAAAAEPVDLQATLTLAEALAGQHQFEEALDLALSVVQTHKKPFVDPARQLMVDIFRLLPDDSPLVTDYRRRLSTALY